MKDILNYYIDYERENRFINTSLKNIAKRSYTTESEQGEEFGRYIFKDKNKASNIIENRKNEKIRKIINLRCELNDIQEKDLNINVMDLVRGNNMGEFIDEFKFKNERQRILDIAKIKDIVKDNNIIICYLLLEKKYTKQIVKTPAIVFECMIENEKLKVKKYTVNRESMSVIISFLENCRYDELEGILGDKFDNLLNNITKIENQEDIEEILKIIDEEIFKMYKSSNIKSIDDFKGYAGWRKLERVFITTEELDEMYEPIFRDEIKRVKERLLDNNENNYLLNQYIIGKNKGDSFESIEKNFKFHMGSYTDKYPINEKQWHVANEVDNISLLSVNGPPGTGKTTLLKEIIADNIVKKAKKLVDIMDDDWKKIGEGRKKIFFSPFDGENPNSIVITSANNKAVDNIGKELSEEIDYFSDCISEINSEEINYKGLLCGRFGKRENMDFFKGQVLKSLIDGLKSNEDYEVNHNVIENFNKVYNELINMQNKLKDFYDKRIELLNNLNIEEKELINIHQIYKIINSKLDEYESTYKNKKIDLENKEILIKENTKKLKNRNYDLDNIEKDIKENSESIKKWYSNLETYRSWKKFKIFKIFIKKLKEFFNEYPSEDYILSEIQSKKEIQKELPIKKANLDREIKILEEETTGGKEEKYRLEEELKILNEKLSKTKSKQGIISKYIKESEKIDDLLGLKSSYIKDIYSIINKNPNNKILKLRKEAFNLSLRVYEEYVKKHSEKIINNLEVILYDNGWFKLFYDSKCKYQNGKSESIKYLWETIFICFPVITTTLHSFGKNTFHLINDYIDLLLVDEAGQIMPHMLISPIYRSRKCVVVGDVKQLEPIVNLNENIIQQHDKIDDKLKDFICIEQNSAQGYADRNSDIYENDKDNTKGIILNEHRRCENSIIEFSNDYVYNGCLNIVNEDNHQKPFGRNNVFFDIRGLKSKNHVNKAEVDACIKIVKMLIKNGIDKADIGIITPFYDHKEALKKAIDGVAIGTIHAFQGQEKKYIIISTVVDGKSSGLIDFVGKKPNMLNVAITRAKSQIIIVGNYEVACNSNNNLSYLINVIRKRGYIYSIYDTELSSNIPNEYWTEGIEIFTDSSNIECNLKYILKNELEGNFIVGPRKHYEALKKLLINTKESIYIVSPWINHFAMNNEMIDIIKKVIDRKAKINIYFGYRKSKYSIEDIKEIIDMDLSYDKSLKSKDVEIIKNLKLILGDGLIYSPPLHTKMLLIDDKYLIIGSHNWLSNNGNSKEEREELSVIISDSDKLNYIKEQYFKNKDKNDI